MSSEFSQLQVTFSSQEEAEKTARALVEKYLVACAQVAGPIRSFYRWKEKLEESTEWLLLAKTRTCLFDEVSEVIHQHHSYDVPQIVALEITDSSAAYLAWMKDQIR